MFSGLRYIMYHYPLTAAVIGIGICMVFLSAVVIFSWYRFSGPTLNAKIGTDQLPASFHSGNALSVSQRSEKAVKSVEVTESSDDWVQHGSSSALSGGSRDHNEDGGRNVTSDEGNDQMEISQPEVTGNGGSDEFEVVDSSKTSEDQAGKRRASNIYKDDEDCVVRQRCRLLSRWIDNC
ncbi:seipin-like isoform X2 [Homarus americanus]|uniref:seipin-like isoform X2 n=1 Tax=Homarus americanus TaxID=6706 RepID=UPI001C470CD9|nr:seipin-like isoform X2 [Homarus americanus]